MRIVYVTGPNRSGTTIGAKILADSMDRKFHPEERFGFRNWRRFKRLTDGVVQCPQVMQRLHEVSAPDVAVVCMLREIGEVQDSFWHQRDHKHRALRQTSLMGHESLAQTRYRYPYNQAVSAYLFWLLDLKPRLHNPFELPYNALRGHRLWHDDRRGWHHRQTAPEDEG